MPVQSDSNPATPSSDTTRLVSSPASTGGAGNVFEQAVGASLLAQLLIGAIPPILIDCVVTEVAFQTEYRGWRTDDFLLVGQTSAGETRKLAGQVKRGFTVSSIDGDFKDSILDFWGDLHNPAIFSAQRDRFAFVVQLGSNTLLREFGGLLECARASRDAEDFEKRLTTKGLISLKAIGYCDEVVSIVKEAEGSHITRREIYPLLRVLHILSLDLATSTRHSEASMKSLLAFTANSDEKQEAAAKSWDELIKMSAEGATVAKVYRREDLPREMLQRHSSCRAEHPMIRALHEHSSTILRGIRSTIGGNLQLPRGALVQKVLTALETSRVVLVSGAAGNGKSAIAKQVMSLLGSDYFAFAFRAEEFAQPHFDTTLSMANIGARAAELNTILASQDKKIVLVESLERLLEKSTRDAFADLLTILRDDPTYRLILTCRDYSADLARAAFFGQFDGEYASVTVPPLTDEELDQVQMQDQSLAIPLASAHLRKILSNPYVLDKARAINWSIARTLPESERGFRDLFWREIIRVDQRPAAGMPDRRDSVFVEIALRRARSLNVYAMSTGLDAEALASLVSDSLVVRGQERPDWIAPSHDVLEDWAILRWLDGLYNEVEEDLGLFQEMLGSHPALRRSYRKWLGELLERAPTSGERLFPDVLTTQNLTAHFVDDTLVGLLQSESGATVVRRHESELVEDDRRLLKRVIHLVRLACVTTPAWAKGKIGAFSVPTGNVWEALLGIVRRAWDTFVSNDVALLALGLVGDWAKTVTVDDPYPPGADDAALIAYQLLDSFDNYSHKNELKLTLEIVAKIPNCQPDRYREMLAAKRQKGRDRSQIAEELQEILFSGPFYNSLPTARDMSSSLVDGLRSHLVCTDGDLREELEWRSALNTELHFGSRHCASHHYFPESAYRTPLLSLLRQHPRATIEFLIELFNHVADWYAHPRIRDRLEPAFETTIILPKGKTKSHWANSRLWQLYRGTSVGPYVLQCYLMALERWLRELAKHQADMLDPILLELLSRTNNAAIAGVVAGVATAFPFQAGESVLSLLSSRDYIVLDRGRMVGDLTPPSQMLDNFMVSRDAEQEFFRDERSEADKWPSRKDDLEAAVRNLQLTDFASRVQSCLDELRAALGPLDKQDDEDRLWRLAIHRMDLREYRVTEDAVVPEERREEGVIMLQAQEPEEDIREFLSRATPRLQQEQQQMSLLMWAYKAFKQELSDTESALWRDRLVSARQEASEGRDGLHRVAAGGPAIMAAACARWYWEELSNEEREWCVDRILDSLAFEADNWHTTGRIQRHGMGPDRSCAYAVVILATKTLTDEQQILVGNAVPLALTHPVDEVRWYATHAAAELWTQKPDLAMRCVLAISTDAAETIKLQTKERRKSYDSRRSYEDLAREAAETVRTVFNQLGAMQERVYDELDLDEWHGAEAQNKILTILMKSPEQPLAVKAFTRGAKQLVRSWETRYDQNARRKRNVDADLNLRYLVERFALRADLQTATQILEPILDAVSRQPDKTNDVVLGILHVEDRDPNTGQFWEIWRMFADRAKSAPWIENIDHRHSSGAEMIRALFLGTQWKETTRHWRALEGHVRNIHELFDWLPPSSCATEAYIRFLYHVGEQSLPDAFIRIHEKIGITDAAKLLQHSNTRYRLEVLLQRYVYAKPLLLKQRPELRRAVLALLDALIGLGSSAAFKMRDDFVTPSVA